MTAMTWTTTVSRMVWRAAVDPTITWTVTTGASATTSSVAYVGGGGVWTVTRDTGLDLDYVRSTVTGLGDLTAFPFFFDGSAAGFLTGADGVVRCYQVAAADGSMIVTTVEDDNPFAGPYQAVDITGAPMTWAGGGPIIDLGSGTGMMIVHVENEYGSGTVDWNYWTLGAAKVVDPGGGVAPTVTWLGPIIRHEMTAVYAETNDVKGYIGSGHYVVHDGDVYVYHLDYTAAGVAQGAVSRCSLTDIGVAVVADDAPVFNKWNGEALGDPWTELGIGGQASTNTSLASIADIGDVVQFADGRWLWAAARPGTPNKIEWAVGTTPLDWSAVETLESDAVDDEWIYTLLWSGDPASPRTLTRETAALYFTAGTRWSATRTERVTLRPVVSARSQGSTYLHTDPADLDVADLPHATRFVVVTAATSVTLPLSSTWPGSTMIDVVNGGSANVTVSAAAGDIPIAGSGDVVVPPALKGEFFLVDSVPLWSGDVFIESAEVTPYDNTTSGLTATTVSEAIDELAASSTGGGGTVDVVSNVAQNRILGRTSSGSGDSEELTPAQTRSLLGVYPAASSAYPGAGFYVGALSQATTYTNVLASSASATAHNRLTFSRIFLGSAMTFDRMEMSVTSAADAGSVIRLGLWEDNNGRPGTLLAQGTVTADSIAVKSLTISASAGPGVVWVGHAWQNGTPTTSPQYQAMRAAEQLWAPGYDVGSWTSSSLLSVAYITTGVTGAFSSSPTVTTASVGAANGNPARIMLRCT